MNISFKLIIIVCVFVFSPFILANKSTEIKTFKMLKKVSLKCHVELVGGKSTVLYHHDLPVKARKSFKEMLLKQYANAPSAKKIYKVHQCIELKKNFKNRAIHRLDKTTQSEG